MTTAPASDALLDPALTAALAKEQRLLAWMAGTGPALVAVSGGVDSTYLLITAHAVLGDAVAGVVADSPSLPRSHLGFLRTLCRDRGIALHEVASREFADPAFAANDAQRCAHCKSALLTAMHALTADPGDHRRFWLGAIADDQHDYRPGMRAAREAGADFPLVTCAFTKADVRRCSQHHGIPGWDRPASPCLSSRIPYGEPVTTAGVAMIEAAEQVLTGLGFATCRARHHRIGDGRAHLCRIEVPVADLERILVHREAVLTGVRAAGYQEVSLDLAGFASGRLNRLLAPTDLRP